MLQRVKTALRISHNLLDDEIEETISTARAEMIRAGVSAEVAASESGVVAMAVKTYCLAILSADDKTREGFWKSWESQLENIRKTAPVRC